MIYLNCNSRVASIKIIEVITSKTINLYFNLFVSLKTFWITLCFKAIAKRAIVRIMVNEWEKLIKKVSFSKEIIARIEKQKYASMTISFLALKARKKYFLELK